MCVHSRNPVNVLYSSWSHMQQPWHSEASSHFCYSTHVFPPPTRPGYEANVILASYPGPSQKAGLVRTVCACALISQHSFCFCGYHVCQEISHWRSACVWVRTSKLYMDRHAMAVLKESDYRIPTSLISWRSAAIPPYQFCNVLWILCLELHLDEILCRLVSWNIRRLQVICCVRWQTTNVNVVALQDSILNLSFAHGCLWGPK